MDRFEALMARGEIAALQVATIAGGRVAYAGAWGRRRIGDGVDPEDKPVSTATKFRVASLSKPFTALGLMKAVEAGLLDLDLDLSTYLGFALRNPAYPDRPLTLSMILSHTSSLEDGEVYNLPLGHHLEECFTPGTPYYEGGAHFGARAPGTFFSYCNLGYAVAATALEAVTGRRFDRYLREEVLRPLGLTSSYNMADLSPDELAGLGVLYRGDWTRPDGGAGGPWIPQFDDHRGRPPGLPCRADPGLGPRDLEAYEVGTNGSLFAPQGGLRASVLDLARGLALFLARGRLEFGGLRDGGLRDGGLRDGGLRDGGLRDGGRLVSEASIDAMCDLQWTWAADGSRGGGADFPGAVGRGLMAFGGGSPQGDRLIPEGGLRMWGHEGNAWGLRGAALFDPEEGVGLAYLLSGTKRDPWLTRGRYSFTSAYEEEVREALIEVLRDGGAWRKAGRSSRW